MSIAKMLAVSLSAVIVSGCLKASPKLQEDYKQGVSTWAAKPESYLIDRAKQAVADRAHDPSSLEYGEFRILPPKGERLNRLVCGSYNAKSLAGRYVGFKDFQFAMGILLDPKETDFSIKDIHKTNMVSGGSPLQASKDCRDDLKARGEFG